MSPKLNQYIECHKSVANYNTFSLLYFPINETETISYGNLGLELICWIFFLYHSIINFLFYWLYQ